MHFGFARHQCSKYSNQAERVLTEGGSEEVVAGSRGVTLIEDEVDDLE